MIQVITLKMFADENKIIHTFMVHDFCHNNVFIITIMEKNYNSKCKTGILNKGNCSMPL